MNLSEFNRNVLGCVDRERVKHMLELYFALGSPLIFAHAKAY